MIFENCRFITTTLLDDLSKKAKNNNRLREYKNLHKDHKDPIQRLINAIEPGSYIRPHRHINDPKAEFLLVIRGSFAFIVFDDNGSLISVDKLGCFRKSNNIAAEIPFNIWHTLISLESGSAVLEIKSGPFVEKNSKEFAHWAPEENSRQANLYLEKLNLAASKI